tara:strand:- start:277 stop:597 length:321 start_codon:yes stop_codon:yes gene_type:complete
MYFAIISNDHYPEETYTSDIYFIKPTLGQLYDKFGDPEDMQGRYYKWCVQVKKIENFKEVHHVAGLEYSEDGHYDDDYVIGGDGYLMDQHEERLTHKCKEKELCGN